MQRLTRLIAMVLVGAAIAYYAADRSPEPTPETAQAQFNFCTSAARITCVVDGDTIWYRGEKIRIADINTPEISNAKCASEKALGQQAKQRLKELLNGGPFQVVRSGSRDTDKYGRLLRVIERDGRSLGDILVSEGLAHRWGDAKPSWC